MSNSHIQNKQGNASPSTVCMFIPYLTNLAICPQEIPDLRSQNAIPFSM
jgi:hypothetical protein